MPVRDSPETPARRSILRNINNFDVSHSNDDDAERRARRRTHGKTNTTNSMSDNLIEEQEGLKNCLKIYHDNKICKENAWSLTLIDNMANLCRNHHNTLKNFQIIGSTLDATSKIYGLRVDSVHSDVLRMTSGLGRFKMNDTHQDDGDNQENDPDNAQNGDDINADGQPKPAAAKKKRVRKLLSTITKNKDTLNARLDTIPLPDPLFSKLNTIMGDVSSSNRLLMNILQTKTSDMRLIQNYQFWDEAECEPNVYSETNEYDWDDAEITTLPLALNIHDNNSLRQQLSGYLITNTPIDDEEEEVSPINNVSFNQSQIDYAFDINAEVEPMPTTENYAIDYDMDDGGGGGDDFNDLTSDDRNAIVACKGLRRVPTVIEDLRPADASKLEYSYRPLDNINQFWAGPSYWKFRKSRKMTMGKDATVASVPTRTADQVAAKRKTNRNKIEPIPLQMFDEDEEDSLFILISSKAAHRMKKTNLHKRWDPKKLKLPTDLHIDRCLFEYYEFCPGIPLKYTDPNSTPQIQTSGYNYDNADDREYCSNVALQADDMDRDTDQEMDRDSIVPDEGILPEADINRDSQGDQTAIEIGQHFEGAPEMIKKIDIQFAKRAKVIDMKQMKLCCMTSISKQCEKTATRSFSHTKSSRNDEEYKEGAATFGVIYHTLPRLLTKTMAENLSPSVAFYSILHLANEHRLRLFKIPNPDDKNVFLIRKLSDMQTSTEK